MEHLKRSGIVLCPYVFEYEHLPIDGDFLYEMEFHEMMSLNHFFMTFVYRFV